MTHEPEILAEIAFATEVIHWRGPSPYYFAAIPDAHVGEIHHAARSASYGWGVVPVEASIGDIEFHTSLFPRDGGYLLPLKDAVRKTARLVQGDVVELSVRVRAPG